MDTAQTLQDHNYNACLHLLEWSIVIISALLFTVIVEVSANNTRY